MLAKYEKVQRCGKFLQIDGSRMDGIAIHVVEQRKGEDHTKERLDIVLINPMWRNMYQDALVKYMPRYISDHSPIFLECERHLVDQTNQRRHNRFRFEHTWMHHPNFQKVLKNSWSLTHMADQLDEQIEKCGAEFT